MRWISLLLFGCLFVTALVGCATADLRPVLDTTKKPKPVAVAPSKPCPKELGSIWCDNSDWNDIYSESPNRFPGDTILVKLSPRFRQQMARRLKREYPVRVKTKVEGIEKGKPKVVAKVENTGEQLFEDDTQQFYVTITEVLPRFLYKVRAQETIRLGGREPIVTLEAEIRNRDIEADESLSSDSLQNTAFEIKPYGGDRQIASEEAAEENS